MSAASLQFAIAFGIEAGRLHAHSAPLHLLHFVARSMVSLLLLGSLGFQILACIAALRFIRSADSRPAPAASGGVSVLKPLCGDDPHLYQNLRSHFLQTYPDFEVLFGVHDCSDPAFAVARRVLDEFPGRGKIIETLSSPVANPKVGQLIALARHARHEIIVINDSDMAVEPDYLQTIVNDLHCENVGLVTALYVGVPGSSLGSRLEAAAINYEFHPGVLTAELVERGMHFALGSTLAFRKSLLQQIGPLDEIGSYLADDYELGNRTAAAGQRVILSRAKVKNFVKEYSFAEFFAHQMRWVSSTRDSRGFGYAGVAFTFTTTWALLLILLTHRPVLTACALAALAARLLTATLMSRIYQGSWLNDAPLMFARDLLALPIWLGGLFGQTVDWRGHKYILRDGQIVAESTEQAEGDLQET